MKRTILLTAAILCAAGTRAQEAYDLLIPEPETPVALRPVEGGRIYRTEVIPYDKRHDADARNLAGADAYMAYTPEPFAASGDAVAVGQVVEIPYVWTDGVVYLHGQRQQGGRSRRPFDARRIRTDALHPRRQERHRADAAPQCRRPDQRRPRLAQGPGTPRVRPRGAARAGGGARNRAARHTPALPTARPRPA